MPLSSSQFKTIFTGDNTNALSEVSQYVKTAHMPRGNAAMNVTAFQTGGNATTSNQQRGAIQSVPQVDFFFDPTVLAILERILGAQGGSTWQFLEGNNASPAAGDQMFQGTFTLFGVNINYSTNQEATISVDLRPTDGGSVVPGWYNN